jgi:DNA-binding CsgD family transcriptional regulator
LLQQLGFEHLLWQLRTVEQLYTWDAMPPGFLEHYYGTQVDQPCAVAEAIRQHWQNFSFDQARRHFAHRPKAGEAEKVWHSFGINDGVVFHSGWGPDCSTTVLCSSEKILSELAEYKSVLVAVAWKLHQLLENHPGLIAISRTLVDLSPKQLEVLRVQIDNPELTLPQQAALLGISPRMLDKRHSQIAARFGVSSFTSAVMLAVKRKVV